MCDLVQSKRAALLCVRGGYAPAGMDGGYDGATQVRSGLMIEYGRSWWTLLCTRCACLSVL